MKIMPENVEKESLKNKNKTQKIINEYLIFNSNI